MELPSKELLSTILGIKLPKHMSRDNGLIHWNLGGGHLGEYASIYNIDHKCKEWAKSLGYCINTLDRPNGLCTVTLSYGIDFDYEKSFNYKKGIHGELPSDIGCILLSCQWVLEERALRL